MSSGEIVKRARKRVGLTQEAVTGGEVTRNLISEIENNKVKLTKQTANIIVKNINKTAIENNIDYYITVEDLLKDKDEQIEDLINEYLKELRILKVTKDNKFKERMNSIEKEMALIKENKKEEIYEIAAEYFYDIYEYKNSEFYFQRCYDIASGNKDNNKMIETIYKLVNLYTRSGEFEKIDNMSRLAENIFKSNKLEDKKYIRNIYFHEALAFENLSEYEKCLKTLNKITSEFFLSNNQCLDIETIKARCYTKLCEFDKAKDIYFHILDEAITLNYVLMIALTYANISELYLCCKDIEDAEIYIEKALKIKDIGDDKTIAEIYYDAFEVYSSKTNNIEKVRMIFYDTLHKIDIIKNEKLATKLFNGMCNYCIKEKSEDGILNILQIIYNRVKTKTLNDEKVITIYLRAYAFLKDVRNNKANDILLKGLEMSNFFE